MRRGTNSRRETFEGFGIREGTRKYLNGVTARDDQDGFQDAAQAFPTHGVSTAQRSAETVIRKTACCLPRFSSSVDKKAGYCTRTTKTATKTSESIQF